MRESRRLKSFLMNIVLQVYGIGTCPKRKWEKVAVESIGRETLQPYRV